MNKSLEIYNYHRYYLDSRVKSISPPLLVERKATFTKKNVSDWDLPHRNDSSRILEPKEEVDVNVNGTSNTTDKHKNSNNSDEQENQLDLNTKEIKNITDTKSNRTGSVDIDGLRTIGLCLHYL